MHPLELPRVVLLPRRARPFFARHPWVFAGSIERVEGKVEPGSEVAVFSHEGQFVARGLFNPQSAIRVRLYRWSDEALDEAFWRRQIESAVALREQTLGLTAPGSACRMIFSESDGLSGLTVDRYDRWLVVQFTSLALFERREMFIPIVLESTGAEGGIVRIERSIAGQEGLPNGDDSVFGSEPPEVVSIVENELRFQVRLRVGQKTGFYLDQRSNRRAVAHYAKDAKVLDLFCYSGAFGLNALRHGGSVHVLGIDSSAPAIDLARQNAVLNGLGSVRFEAADVFETLSKLRERREIFGLVICDPPKFAKSSRNLDEALKGYLRLNRAAVDVIEPGGILATCSCSGHVDRTVFADLLGHVAELSGRSIQILENRGQAADHPVSASCLETDYLKCVICRVN